MKKSYLLIFITLFIINLTAKAQGTVGIGTISPKAAFNVAENKTVLFGKDTSGTGGKLMWIPSKYAFRVGAVGKLPGYATPQDSTTWNYDSIGVLSFAAGYQNKAIGYNTIAMGYSNEVRGYYSAALGLNNKLSSSNAFAAGANNQSSGTGNVTLGSLNISTGNHTFLAGKENKTEDDNTIAVGYNNIASKIYATAIGANNQALGIESISLGSSNTSTGRYSFASGTENNAVGEGSIALGYDNNANTIKSITIGSQNRVTANAGTTLGNHLHAKSYYSTVVGLNNDSITGSNPGAWVDTDPLFIVGGGRFANQLKNVMVIIKNGKTGFGTNNPHGLLHSKYNSSPGDPQLLVEETEKGYSRITFKNQNEGFWDIEACTRNAIQDNDLAHFNFYFSLHDYIFSLRGNGIAILTGTLYENSDERLKKNILPLNNSLEKLTKLNGYTYNWKDSGRAKEEQIGFLAQEVEKQFPQLVITDETGKKSVAYGNMVPVLLEAIKEQQKQIESLEKRLDKKGL